jgi:hypothetical protein
MTKFIYLVLVAFLILPQAEARLRLKGDWISSGDVVDGTTDVDYDYSYHCQVEITDNHYVRNWRRFAVAEFDISKEHPDFIQGKNLNWEWLDQSNEGEERPAKPRSAINVRDQQFFLSVLSGELTGKPDTVRIGVTMNLQVGKYLVPKNEDVEFTRDDQTVSIDASHGAYERHFRSDLSLNLYYTCEKIR